MVKSWGFYWRQLKKDGTSRSMGGGSQLMSFEKAEEIVNHMNKQQSKYRNTEKYYFEYHLLSDEVLAEKMRKFSSSDGNGWFQKLILSDN